MLLCGNETWVQREFDTSQIGIFERKILNKMYGSIQENGEWHIKKTENYERMNNWCNGEAICQA